MTMGLDVVLGGVVIAGVAMMLAVVLVVRHSGSSCLWANTKTGHMTDQRTEIFPRAFTIART
jgi:hypothetical protein